MPKVSKLTEYEKGAVESFELSGINCRSIEKEIGRSKAISNKFLRSKDEYRKKHDEGRPKNLSHRDGKKVLKLASTGKYSSKEILKRLGSKCAGK